MSPKVTSNCPLLAALALAAPSFAIAQSEAPQIALPIDFGSRGSTVHYQESGGGIWARGADYKAQFQGGRFQFIPFLGSDAPMNYPVSFTLRGVTLGGDAVSIDRGPTLERVGDQIRMDHGTLVELYDLRPDSIEQSFELPLGSTNEELILRIGVDTELEASNLDDGIAFLNSRGGVTYEHALVYDARGQRLALPIQWGNGEIQLRVPAAFMAQAIAPVVVDPLIATFEVGNGLSPSMVHTDVAHNGNYDRFVYANIESFSSNDRDIYIAAFDGLTGALEADTYADMTTTNFAKASIANNNTSGVAMIVSERPGPVRTDIVGHFVNVNTMVTWGPTPIDTTLSAPPATTAFSPDVGGYSGVVATQGSGFRVVWMQRGTQIQTFSVLSLALSNLGTPGAYTVLSTGISTVRFDIKISKTAGEASLNEWRVIWIEPRGGTTGGWIYGARLAVDGTLIQPRTFLYSPPNQAFLFDSIDVSEGLVGVPGAVTGDPVSCMVLATRSNNDRDVWAVPLEGSMVGQAARVDDAEHLNVAELLAAVGTTNDEFVIAGYDKPGFLTRATHTTLNYTNEGKFAVRDRREALYEMNYNQPLPQPGVASRYSGGFYASDVVATAHLRPSIGIAALDARGALISYPGEPAVGAQFCFGTPNTTGEGGFLTILGDNSRTTPKTLRASHLPANVFGFFVVSQGGTTEFSPGGSSGTLCIGGSPIGRMNQPGQISNAGPTGVMSIMLDPTAIPSGTGTVPANPGSTWSYQAWHRDGAGSSNFTNAVSLLLE